MLPTNTSLSAKRTISISILIFINFLFAFKYLDRVFQYAIIPSALACLLYIILWNYRNSFRVSAKILNIIFVSLVVLFVGLSFLIFYKFPLESLNVDRWSVITSFWEAFFNGDYVYYSKSYAGNPPGAMPFYFIFSLPFLMVDELGVMPLFGLLIFLVIVSRTAIKTNDFLWVMVFLLTSFFFLWEIPTRSNLFLNSTLFLGLVALLNKVEKERLELWFVVSAILTGFLLSTRFVLVIPMIILFIWFLRSRMMNFKMMFLFGIIAFISFLITFIPFVINHFDDFFAMNPILLQSTLFIPFYYIVLFIVLAIASAFLCKKSKDIYFFSGLVLFFSITIYFIYHVVVFGFERAYLGSIIDISYFIFCTPFLIYYLVGENVEKSKLEPTYKPDCVEK